VESAPATTAKRRIELVNYSTLEQFTYTARLCSVGGANQKTFSPDRTWYLGGTQHVNSNVAKPGTAATKRVPHGTPAEINVKVSETALNTHDAVLANLEVLIINVPLR